MTLYEIGWQITKSVWLLTLLGIGTLFLIAVLRTFVDKMFKGRG